MVSLIKLCIPHPLQVSLVRLARWPRCFYQWRHASDIRGRVEAYPFVLSEHATPLLRENSLSTSEGKEMQHAKETNLRVAAAKTHCVLLAPQRQFSYHSLVGWPTRLRGFKVGLELKNGKPSKGVGGGCCSLSNLLYLIALQSGLSITERHRHGLDLFPDHQRKIPFGCGATVFYPYADLKFTNPFNFPVLIETLIEEGHLVGRVRCERDPGFHFTLEERDHVFNKVSDTPDTWFRENSIHRRKVSSCGTILSDTLIVKNKGRCLYDPEFS